MTKLKLSFLFAKILCGQL